MKAVMWFVTGLMATSCLRVPVNPPAMDQRYWAAVKYMLADTARYNDLLPEAQALSYGLRVADTVYCTGLTFFLKDVFEMAYGKYSSGNPYVSDFHSQIGNRYRNCQGRLLPGLEELSITSGPEIVIFFSQILDDVIPFKDGIKAILVPNYPGKPNFKEFIDSYHTSYEYLFLFDSLGQIDTVFAGKVLR